MRQAPRLSMKLGSYAPNPNPYKPHQVRDNSVVSCQNTLYLLFELNTIFSGLNVTLRHKIGRAPPQAKATAEPKRPIWVKSFDFGIPLDLASDRSYLSYFKRICTNLHCIANRLVLLFNT